MGPGHAGLQTFTTPVMGSLEGFRSTTFGSATAAAAYWAKSIDGKINGEERDLVEVPGYGPPPLSSGDVPAAVIARAQGGLEVARASIISVVIPTGLAGKGDLV